MKKFIAIILVSVAICLLIGCKKSKPNTSSSPINSSYSSVPGSLPWEII